jgi:hypothetical protein
MYSSGSREAKVAHSCEHSNEPSDSRKTGNVLVAERLGSSFSSLSFFNGITLHYFGLDEVPLQNVYRNLIATRRAKRYFHTNWKTIQSSPTEL